MTYRMFDVKKIGLIVTLAAVLSVGMALPSGMMQASIMQVGVARAQSSGATQVGSSPKGTIGLGLVGAELGLVIPAAAGLDDTWALVVFPLIGGAGGAVAGHYLLDNGSRTLSIGALALGLALIVPSIVITLSVTAYDPEDEGGVEGGSDHDAEATGGGDGSNTSVEVDSGDSASVRRRRLARAGVGLFRLSEDGLMLGVPGLSVLPTQGRAELSFMRTEEGTELRLSLLSGVF